MISRPLQVLLAVTLIIVVVMYFRGGEEPASLLPPPRAATPALVTSTHGPVSALSALAPASMTNLFPPQSWTPPPPPSPPPEHAPKPIAPPLPFALAALWRDDQNEYVVLRAGTERFVLCRNCAKTMGSRPGSVLLHNYRIDSVSRNQVSFTFLPLQEKQVLHLGDQP